MRELRVEDALLYLDQVKVEFGDRPHIYNEFLDIMKTFKTQQIDTPGVIRRVSTLFQGNRKLVLGFNTFLPEGYKIEIPEDGRGPPIAVYRAPGSNAAHILRESPESQAVQLARHLPQPPAGQPGGPPGMGQPPPGVAGMRGPPQGPPPGQGPPRHPGLPPEAKAMAMEEAAYSAKGPPGVIGMPPEKQGPPGPRGQPPMPQMMPSDAGGVGPRRHMEGPPTQQGRPPHQHLPGGVAPRGQSQQIHTQKSPPPPQGLPINRQPTPDGKPPAMPPGGPRNQRPLPGGPPPRPPGDIPSQPGPQRQRTPPPGAPPPPRPPPAAPQPQQPQGQQQPMEFDHAINYVTTIKRRFATEPETYKKFLEILHTYQKEQRGIKEVLDDVSNLFSEHPDLLKEFTYFLPDAVQAQAKAQLDVAAKEAEARKKAKANKAIMNTAQTMQQHAKTIDQSRPPAAAAPVSSGARAEYDVPPPVAPVPFGGAQGRSVDRESSIIRRTQYGKVTFDPLRPPKKNTLTPTQAAVKHGRPTAIPELPRIPNTTESSFFQRAKEHLNRKELAADKPQGTRRHTPWTEFLKTLHLFGAGVLNKDELILLLKGLFMQGHAPKSGANASGGNSNPSVAQDATDLLKEFEEIIIGRGPFAQQETASKDKSKYGALRARDFDYGNCEKPTPSYLSYPGDYPKSLFLAHPGQTGNDRNVLNSKFLCIDPFYDIDGQKRNPRTIEESDGARKRHNVYEEMMFRLEDERYELDMAIERNVHALRRIEPMVEEVQALREQEEKDGQPIGRLRYKLERYALNTIHINAIGRIYGDRGDEVLQHLLRNPMIVLPIVYQRLKQKDVEWRKAKVDLSEKWNSIQESNYEGSLDVQCYFNRRELERTFASSLLKDQCKRVRSFIKHPNKLRDHKSTRDFMPTFGNRIPDFGAVLHQPFVATECKVNGSHKHAFDLITHRIKSMSSLSSLNRERIGRIWAEFMVPWFDYPVNWVAGEVRDSFGGKLTPSMVQFVPGQRVKTIVGEGSILCFMRETNNAKPRYRVRLPFGISFLSPSAIFHAIPSKDTPFVRRDGVMVRDESSLTDEDSLDADKLDKKYKLLFGTESIYLFLRLYTLLCSLLSNTHDYCESRSPADPNSLYHNPQMKLVQKETSPGLNLSGVTQVLKKVLSKDMPAWDYVNFARKVCREKVHQMAAMPKLVEKCSDLLVKIAKEDALLQVYDFCHYNEVDPVAVRTQCLAVVPEAIYRIQYDVEAESVMYCYLPENEPLLANPRGEYDDIEDDTNGETGDDPMDEDDPIEEFEDGPPVSKRIRLK